MKIPGQQVCSHSREQLAHVETGGVQEGGIQEKREIHFRDPWNIGRVKDMIKADNERKKGQLQTLGKAKI